MAMTYRGDLRLFDESVEQCRRLCEERKEVGNVKNYRFAGAQYSLGSVLLVPPTQNCSTLARPRSCTVLKREDNFAQLLAHKGEPSDEMALGTSDSAEFLIYDLLPMSSWHYRRAHCSLPRIPKAVSSRTVQPSLVTTHRKSGTALHRAKTRPSLVSRPKPTSPSSLSPPFLSPSPQKIDCYHDGDESS